MNDRKEPGFSNPAKKSFRFHWVKKSGLLMVCVVAAIGILFAAGWHIPFPIEGNWGSPLISCMCTEHEFLRFEKGRIMNMSGHPPSHLLGSYRKTGFGRYELDWFMSCDFPRSVRSTFLRVNWEGSFKFEHSRIKGFIRDPLLFASRRILNDPENDW